VTSRIQILLVLLLNFLILGRSFAQEVTDVRPPKVLYHWLRFSDLKTLGESYEKNAIFPLKKIDHDFLVVNNIPSLSEKPGLYAWTNPVTGIAAAATEIYGKGEALLKLEIDDKKLSRKIKAVRITTSGPIEDLAMTEKILGADLILHQIIFPDTGKIYLQEWIILNPNIIAKASADPLELKVNLKKDLARLKDEKYRYRRATLHAPLHSPADNITNYMKRVVIEFVTDFLKYGTDKVPTIFLTKSLTANSCERYYSY
jgi:hypothetical protein